MPIRWDKFTVKAQEAVQRANQLASEHGNPELRPIHLLAALLEDKEGIVPPVLEKIGIGPQAVLAEVYKELEKLPRFRETPLRSRSPTKSISCSSKPLKKPPTSRTNTSPPSTCCSRSRSLSATPASRSSPATALPMKRS